MKLDTYVAWKNSAGEYGDGGVGEGSLSTFEVNDESVFLYQWTRDFIFFRMLW